ncbi:MAG TPA: polyhydroxyalkanoate depolymerase [Stellaceae bacterium]|nr:polyhydroxyalkanoate depolymerase [Stellaceae bacterium]
MIYQNFQTYADTVLPLRSVANMAAAALANPVPGISASAAQRGFAALCELIARAGLSHRRPSFGIDQIAVGNRSVAVREVEIHATPFGGLLHFKKDLDIAQPRVLLVAPMSGHFATLLRSTARTLLAEHDVYITDWHNARDVALKHGGFGFDDFIEHVITFLEVIGPGGHVVAVCQPCVAVLAATAIMAEDDHPATPRSMTLMAGPIDTRINPTAVNHLATSRPLSWFERNLIDVVPPRYNGAWRRVYPGFTQLAAFISMNLARHIKAQLDLFCHLANGEAEKAAAIRSFYDEYLAVMDLPAEFYLETVRAVFQEHELPQGRLKWNGRRINPGAIRRTALFTVEGERDDICAVGQTLAAQELCSGLRPYLKRHHVQTGVGHYGVFNGQRWGRFIYPMLRNVVYSSD